MPTSLRFVEGAFKNGADPYRMYQTLTHGYGLMNPQSWAVPRQKYDVIHYVREALVKPHNPRQYVEVDADYLTRAVKPKQFIHIDQTECIACEGCVDICPWKCIHMVRPDAGIFALAFALPLMASLPDLVRMATLCNIT